jgi:hypothetical protein
MNEVISRLESGESPDSIDASMPDVGGDMGGGMDDFGGMGMGGMDFGGAGLGGLDD